MLGSHWACEFLKPNAWFGYWLIEPQNGGHCQPAIYHNPPEIGGFELRNYKFLQELIADHNIACEWKTLEGCHPYYDDDLFASCVSLYQDLKDADPGLGELVRIITRESENPSLADLRVPDAVGAFLQENAASLWPYKLVCWTLETLLETTKKFNLQTNTPVTSLQKVGGDESWMVHTSRGVVAARNVILTTNAYTSHLLPKMKDLIVPVQAEMSALLPPKAVQPSSVVEPLLKSYVFVGHDKKKDLYGHDYLIQRPFSSSGGGELMFGGGRQYAPGRGVGIADDSFTPPTVAKYLRNELNQTHVISASTSGKELQATHEWTGILGFSRDGKPWVGEVSEELDVGGGKGLWICAGFTGHGTPNTTGSAKAVVDMMLGEEAENIDLPGTYRVSRARIDRAREGDEVHVADKKGFFP